MEFRWHDIDPETGKKRFLSGERFAGQWSFKFKFQKRGDWTKGLIPTLEIWEHILDGLKRRYQRSDGVDENDVGQVEKIIKNLPKPRELD